jgi:hypothetical protein
VIGEHAFGVPEQFSCDHRHLSSGIADDLVTLDLQPIQNVGVKPDKRGSADPKWPRSCESLYPHEGPSAEDACASLSSPNDSSECSGDTTLYAEYCCSKQDNPRRGIDEISLIPIEVAKKCTTPQAGSSEESTWNL